jgi:TonB-dependent starch-binding outer membrane protein SusC
MSDKLKNIRLVLALMFVLITCSVSAQAIKGTVKDTSGEPVIGASVVEENTTNGKTTDVNGNFSITVSGKKPLVISYLGMKKQKISVAGKKVINVVLEDANTTLNEIVAIGYGTLKKKDLTGSVASVTAKQLAAVPVSSAAQAIQGKMAGVSVMQTEGSPDADIRIRVRGGGSLSQDNSPLYIVDGFPVSSISDIAPTDIETIDVLKDASSTAIYGARGANGVVIVTTKSGKDGKTEVHFGSSIGIRKVAKTVDVMDPYDYARYQYELGSTDYGDWDDLDIWKSVNGNDYQDQIFGRTGFQQLYNVSVNGGNKDTKYNISYARDNDKSIMYGSDFSKDNINVKLNSNMNKWLNIDFNARLSYVKTNGLGSGADANESNAANSIVANSVRFRPIDALSSDDDEETSTTKQYSPMQRLNATYKQVRKFNQNYNAGINWKPFKEITIRSEFGYGWTYTDTDQAWGSEATQNSSLGSLGMPQTILTKYEAKNWRNANTITYDTKKIVFDNDHLNILIGQEVSSTKSNTHLATTVAFPTSMSISEILANQGSGTALANYGYIDADDNLSSFFGRINYTLNDKYLFTATLRADGSSKFAKGHRWGYFPSVAFAWRLMDEKFMEETKDWLSNFKLRLSFGTAGNNRIPSGLIKTTYAVTDATARAPYFNETVATMMEHGTTLSNPNLKWETTITRNIGIDYGFFNNKIYGALDLYWNTTKDLLMKTEISSNSGYNYQYQNFGKTSNKGVELTFNANIIDHKKFTLDFTANISYNYNKIDDLNSTTSWQSSNWAGSTISKYEDFKVEAGGQLGEIWGYKTNGFYTVYNATNNPNGELIWNGNKWALRDGIIDKSTSITGGNLMPGGLKLQVDGDGNPIKQKLGNSIAPWYGGFGLNATYKNFDASVFCNYSIGNKLINGTKLATSFYTGSAKGYNLNGDFSGNRYTWVDPNNGCNLGYPTASLIAIYGGIDNLITRLNEMNVNATIYNPCAVTTMQLTDYAVEDASFLRLQTVTLGYSLPKSLLRNFSIQNIRFYFTGYNLLCWTNYSGADPEVDTSSKKNAMCPGIDYAAYPKSRMYVFGVNVTF